MGQITTTKDRINSVRDLLARDSVKAQIAMVAPKHLTADRITRIAMTSIMQTPKLAECTPASLLGCLLTCTQLGLEPDGVSGMAYLIPYGKTATLIVGYKGLMSLARRSGEITGLEARVVFDCDTFSYEYGSNPYISHKPGDSTNKKMTHVYAVARFVNGTSQFEVMGIEDVNAIRKRSKASGSGPWVTDFNEMARKTVMRRLCKYLPSSPELQTAVALDECADRGIPQEVAIIDVESEDADTPEEKPEHKKLTLSDIAGQGAPE